MESHRKALEMIRGRIGVQETAQILGFTSHDLAVLIARRLLKPLGNPAPNAPKFFAASDVYTLEPVINFCEREIAA